MNADLFRHASGRLISALVRSLGRAHLALAEDAAQEAMLAAAQEWPSRMPEDPGAWLFQVARRRAIDVLRRERRAEPLEAAMVGVAGPVPSSRADAENQLMLMFAICDERLSVETQVTLVLRLLCGLSPSEIAAAFFLDVATIDRRLHRGRARLQEAPRLEPLSHEVVRARQPAIERALYLLFNEGYRGHKPALCADALRLCELLLEAEGPERRTLHALAAVMSFNAARLPGRLDAEGVLLPLEDQPRALWDVALINRGIAHLGGSAEGEWSRWHLEAGIAFEHVRAESFAQTDWPRIVAMFDVLLRDEIDPLISFSRTMALSYAGRLSEAYEALINDTRLEAHSFYWAGRADLDRRAGRFDSASRHYERAISLSRNDIERRSLRSLSQRGEGRGEGK